MAAPAEDVGSRALAAIEQLKAAHRVSYENGQRLARLVGEIKQAVDSLDHATVAGDGAEAFAAGVRLAKNRIREALSKGDSE